MKNNPTSITCLYLAILLCVGTAANADAKSAHKNPIENNRQAIADNAAAIDSNSSAIENNTTDIATNSALLSSIPRNSGIIVRDGNGRIIGSMAGLGTLWRSFHLLNPEGYLLPEIDLITGTFSYVLRVQLLYTSTDCTGQTYTQYFANGMAYQLSMDSSLLYYIPKTALPVTNLTIYSTFGSSSKICKTLTTPFTYDHLWASFPNDSAVTGTDGSPYTLPLTFENAR